MNKPEQTFDVRCHCGRNIHIEVGPTGAAMEICISPPMTQAEYAAQNPFERQRREAMQGPNSLQDALGRKS
jgi:hypothetical protein